MAWDAHEVAALFRRAELAREQAQAAWAEWQEVQARLRRERERIRSAPSERPSEASEGGQVGM